MIQPKVQDTESVLDLWEQVHTLLHKFEVIGIAVALETYEGMTTHQFGMDTASLALASALFNDYAKGQYQHHREH